MDEIKLSIEDARRLLDLATDSPLVCSGSFESDDVRTLRRLARVIGIDPETITPDEFIRDYPHAFRPSIREDIERLTWKSPEFLYRGYRETDAQVRARLGEAANDDRCDAGRYNRKCGRRASDPLHAPGAPDPGPRDDCGSCGEQTCDGTCGLQS